MDILALSGSTGCLSSVTLAAGTTTTVTSTGAIVYAINGKAYTAAALSNTAHPTTDINTGVAFVGIPIGYGAVIVYGLNAAKALKATQGALVALDGAYNFIAAPQFPAVPADFCPIGYLVVKAGSGSSTWTAATSNQASATGITYARQDVALGLPDRVQTS